MDLPVGIATLQHTDRWIGVPLCFFLTLLRKIVQPQPPTARQPGKILFVKFAEQGSTVLAYPAIRRAIELVGRENVYFVVFEDNRFILDAMEVIPEENVITIPTQSPFALGRGALRAILRARRIGIDSAVDMEFFTRFSAMLTFLTGARSRVGFHTFFGDGPYRGDLMTHRLLYNSHLHTSQMFEAMVEALTRDPNLLPTFDFTPSARQDYPAFRVRPSESAEIAELLQRENPQLGSAPLVLLNPNAGDLLPLRRWSALRYVELSRRLLGRFHPYAAFSPAGTRSARRVDGRSSGEHHGPSHCDTTTQRTGIGQDAYSSVSCECSGSGTHRFAQAHQRDKVA
jgi:ADP-heptose:LPS heptosyltransferase